MLQKQSEKEAHEAQQIIDAVKSARQKISTLKSSVHSNSEKNDKTSNKVQEAPISDWFPKKGDTVYVESINAMAVVAKVQPNGTMTLQAGLMSMKATRDQVRPV